MVCKGYYSPQNSQKYLGTLPIIYRSSWELSVMNWCDKNPSIISWGSESIIINYFYTVDKKYHRYFIDFIIKFRTGETYLIEIKPESKTKPPDKNKSGRMTKRYITESLEFEKNRCKWLAATKYCQERGYIFEVWTEKYLRNLDIFVK